jgi:hypothetical protein
MARRRELFTELAPFDDHPWAWARQQERSALRVSPRPAAGTPAKISPSHRCALNASSRFGTTTWKAVQPRRRSHWCLTQRPTSVRSASHDCVAALARLRTLTESVSSIQ